ncbi:MAG: methionyl-tRNA formyltransferase [Rhodospirillales bacterium]|nr:methionyl-tRNA formyltransferase [Rhodospirillales bacterium]
MTRLRLAFMGAAAFAVPALNAVHGAGHRIAAVYSQPPRPAGRGRKERPTPVHARADELGITVATPRSLKGEEKQAAFAALNLDVAVVAAYGLLLPRTILDAPRLGCVNIHPSLLPRWRGAAPAAHAILSGDTETGMTIMLMDEGLDTGPILAQRRVPVPPRATTASLEAELSDLGALMLLDVLSELASGVSTAVPQAAEGATYASRFAKEDGRLDWSRPAADLDRIVRALSPWPGAFSGLDDTTVKVLEAEPVDGSGAPGTLLDRDMTVACGRGALRLVKVQRAGKPTTDGAALLRGLRLDPGASLG